MKEQATAFLEETEALYALLKTLPESAWSRPTLFKGWTINDVMAHLHSGNVSADLSLHDREAYNKMKADRARQAEELGLDNRAITHVWLNHVQGKALLEMWHQLCQKLARDFEVADPKKRVPWAGRDMSARSSISARLMEHWAHGQEIYDLLGMDRVSTDRIRNIAVLCVNTFGWTFNNRKMTPPPVRPRVRLTAPSGEVWEWEPEPNEVTSELIEGSAEQFCQVCAQTRNIADTQLKVTGDAARQWMSLAQCFAGPPRQPPAQGARYKQAA
jgi:uncharacterized protein (TIGR03084 family)